MKWGISVQDGVVSQNQNRNGSPGTLPSIVSVSVKRDDVDDRKENV